MIEPQGQSGVQHSEERRCKTPCIPVEYIYHHWFQFTPTGWTTGVRFPAGVGKRYFSLHHRFQTGSGARRVFYPITGAGGGWGRVGWPHPPSAEIKNVWGYTSTPPVRLHGVV